MIAEVFGDTEHIGDLWVGDGLEMDPDAAGEPGAPGDDDPIGNRGPAGDEPAPASPPAADRSGDDDAGIHPQTFNAIDRFTGGVAG